MSQILKGVFGALAVTLTFGAVQYASGHDLVGSRAGETRTGETTGVAPAIGVNRTTKADRATVLPSSAPTQTVALRFDALADTSVLVRVPIARNEARSRPAPSETAKSVDRKVACEPVVSVLTEVAKRLQPGRCVT